MRVMKLKNNNKTAIVNKKNNVYCVEMWDHRTQSAQEIFRDCESAKKCAHLWCGLEFHDIIDSGEITVKPRVNHDE